MLCTGHSPHRHGGVSYKTTAAFDLMRPTYTCMSNESIKSGGRKFCYGFLSRAYLTIEINAYELLYATGSMTYKYIPSDGKSIDTIHTIIHCGYMLIMIHSKRWIGVPRGCTVLRVLVLEYWRISGRGVAFGGLLHVQYNCTWSLESGLEDWTTEQNHQFALIVTH